MTTVSTTTRTRTVTVNAAFLEEIKDVNQELWQLIEKLHTICGEPDLIRAEPRQFVILLAQLRDMLAMHFSLEEAFGYFEDPVFVAPHLGERADRLRRQHRSLYVEACELVEYAERRFRRGRMSGPVAQICQRFLVFHEQLQRHESDERVLILEAYEVDIGVGD